jgi:GxxExxY protein
VGEYRADIVVENRFLVELKSVENLSRAHEAQVYNYLRLSRLPVAMLLNFGPAPVYRRLVLPVRSEA